MLKLRDKLAAVFLLTLSFVPSAHAGEDQVFGTLTGAAVGGVVGSQFGHGDGRIAGATVGVLAGGWIGNDIGYDMDNSKGSAASGGSSGGYRPPSADMVARQTGQPDYSPNYVAADDSPSPESVYGNSCRQYPRQMLVHGQIQDSYGVACMQPDGTWQAIDQ